MVDELSFLPWSEPDLGNETSPLSSLSADVLQELLAIGEPVAFGEGEIIISEELGDRVLYLLSRGSTETLLPLSGDEMRRVSVQAAPTLLGEVSFIDGASRTATVRSLEPCEGRRLDHEDFRALVRQQPALAHVLTMAIARSLTQRLRRVTALLGQRVP